MKRPRDENARLLISNVSTASPPLPAVKGLTLGSAMHLIYYLDFSKALDSVNDQFLLVLLKWNGLVPIIIN